MFAGLLLLLLAPRAAAEDGFDAHGFNLAAFDGDPRVPVSVHSPGHFGQGDVFVGGLLEYASRPLVYVVPELDGGTQSNAILDDVLALNLSAGVAPLSWLRLDVAAPVFLSSIGPEGESQGAAMGDLRLAATGRILRGGEKLGLGVVPYLDVPTGSPEKYLGQGGVAGGGAVVVDYTYDHWTLNGELGAQFQPALNLENLQNGNHAMLGVAGGYLLSETMGFQVEGHFSIPFVASEVAGTAAPAEMLVSLRSRSPSGVHWTGGIGLPLSRGVGAAQYRFFLGGGWGKVGPTVPKVVDADGDGFQDPVDRCPTDPETVNRYNDEDGCPDQLGTLDVLVQRNGKPVAMADLKVTGGPEPVTARSALDAPVRLESLMPGSSWQAEASLGACLSGRGEITVGEGVSTLLVDLWPHRDAAVVVDVVGPEAKPIPNAVITWDQEANGCVAHDPFTLNGDGRGRQTVGVGKHTLYVTTPGFGTWSGDVDPKAGEEVPVHVVLHPTKLRLEQTRIVILEKVYFDTASAVILERSYDLLDEVANTLRSHPELRRVEVAGYTDSDGNDTYNQHLSQQRVDSVRAYLLHRGVSPEQLISKGYGEGDPVVPNTSKSNKAQNRRVEFHILERVEPGAEAGAVTPGPATPPAPEAPTSILPQ